ncbi:MAG: glycosyltransferase family 2 protein [Sedimentisphaerales bacterium]|nr:glycosyltransferase family 2 protein [Sedimentisphaerales bacterium]
MPNFDTYMTLTKALLAFQGFMLYQNIRSARFSLRMIKTRPANTPHRAAIICPCKGIDTAFEKNMASLLVQQHPYYQVIFAVEDSSDPAYSALQRIIETNRSITTAEKVEIIIAGHATKNSQKVHNQLAAVAATLPDREIFAFVDSDACLNEFFLHTIGSQLRRERNSVATGYRWFVPEDTKLSSYALSAINAFFAGQLGDHKWNSAWGGAMAITKDNFYKFEVDKIWSGALSDDYSLTWIVKHSTSGYVYYHPACLLPSYEKTDWKNLFNFARRQFIITRCCLTRLWWYALGAFSMYLFSVWGGLAFCLYLFATGSDNALRATYLPAGMYISGIIKASARQYAAFKTLKGCQKKLTIPALIDIFCQPLLNVFTLAVIISAGFTRSIVWRNKKYTIAAIDKTIIEPAAK